MIVKHFLIPFCSPLSSKTVLTEFPLKSKVLVLFPPDFQQKYK